MRRLVLGFLLSVAGCAPATQSASLHAARLDDHTLAERLRQAYRNDDGVFLPRTGRLVFGSNRDGKEGLWIADDNPSRPAQRLADFKQRMVAPTPLPDESALLFLSDTDGDEQMSLFRVELASRAVTELTPHTKLARHAPHVPKLAPERAYFSAAERMKPGAAVFEASSSAPGESREIYRSPVTGFLTDVSPDGRFGLFIEVMTHTNRRVVVVDLRTGDAKPLYPTSGNANIGDAVFSHDRVLLTTDGGGEQGLLLLIDPATQNEIARHVEPKATLEGIAVSADHIGLTASCGNHTELRLLDSSTLRPRAPIKLPLGRGNAVGFSADGSRMIANWSTPDTPGELFDIDVTSGAAKPLRAEGRASLDGLPPMTTSIENVKMPDGLIVPVHIYAPKTAGKHPVIVRYHGGPAGPASIGWSPLARYFVSKGYVWVEPNVRGSAGFGRGFEEADNGKKRPAALDDVDRIGEWVSAQSWADSTKLVALGESYGGYEVLMTLTRKPTLWRAGVDISGFTNLRTMMTTTTGAVRHNYLTEVGDPAIDGDFLDEISPLGKVDKIAAPLFVYAGKNDPRVPSSEADQVVAALRKKNLPVEYMLKEDGGHSISDAHANEFYTRVARFLDKSLDTRK